MARSASPWILGARSETGYVRTANEDRMGWTRAPFGDVYVISDGMGGYRGGALAAELTIRVLQEQLIRATPDSREFPEQVREAFLAANRTVRERRDPADPETSDMGATGVALITSGRRFAVAHVGDSRGYLWRRGKLEQLTRDHSRVQAMVDNGLLTPEQAAAHPDASVLDRAIGHKPDVQVDVSEWRAVEAGDMLLLCSDGLCGYVRDEEIAAVLQAGGTPRELTDRLVGCALAKGGEDNVTVQLVGYALSRRRAARAVGVLPASLAASALTATVLGTAGYAWHRERIQQLQAEWRQAPVATGVAQHAGGAPIGPADWPPAPPAPASVATSASAAASVATSASAAASAPAPVAPASGAVRPVPAPPAPPPAATRSTARAAPAAASGAPAAKTAPRKTPPRGPAANSATPLRRVEVPSAADPGVSTPIASAPALQSPPPAPATMPDRSPATTQPSSAGAKSPVPGNPSAPVTGEAS